LTPLPKYNSFPSTSGPHYIQPAPWNFYDSPLDSEVRAVHNLEHGGIVIQWGGPVPTATVEQLRGFWQDSPKRDADGTAAEASRQNRADRLDAPRHLHPALTRARSSPSAMRTGVRDRSGSRSAS